MLLNEASQDKLKRIRDSGLFCCVQIISDFNYVWDIGLTVYNKKEDGHGINYQSGSYEDLDDAVNSLYSQIEGLLK